MAKVTSIRKKQKSTKTVRQENEIRRETLRKRLVRETPFDLSLEKLNPAARNTLLNSSAKVKGRINPRRLNRALRVSLYIADPKTFVSYIPFGSMKVGDVDTIAEHNETLLKDIGMHGYTYKFSRYAWTVALNMNYTFFRKILVEEIGQFRQWGHLRQLIVTFPNLITWFDNDTIDAMVLRPDSLIHLAASNAVLGKGQVISPNTLKHALHSYISMLRVGELPSTQLMTSVAKLEAAIRKG